jgi:hypothetical protein
LLPAVTGLGDAEFVTLTSAWVPEATAMFTVAELSRVLLSRVALAPMSVSLMMVPAATPALTL